MARTFTRREQYKQALDEIESQQIPLTQSMIDYLNTIINTITTFTTIPVYTESLASWNIPESYVDNMLTMKKSQLLYNTQLMDNLTSLRKMLLKQMEVQTSSIKEISATFSQPQLLYQGFTEYSDDTSNFDNVPYTLAQDIGIKSSSISLPSINYIAGGESHVALVLPNGKVYTTGVSKDNNLGRTATSSALTYNFPVEGIPSNVTVLQVDTRYRTTLVLTDMGLYTFGKNVNCQLGNGNCAPQVGASIVRGFLWRRVDRIAAGAESSYAIDREGMLWAWGGNDAGQLGDGTMENKVRPVSVNGILRGKKVKQVCAGSKFALALTNDNVLVSFGSNANGQLGNPSSPSNVSQPVPVVQTGSLLGKEIKKIACGSEHALVLTADNEIHAWGDNAYGQLGIGSRTDQYSPVKVSMSACIIKDIFTKHYVSIVTCTNNAIFSWGRNNFMQTGRGSEGIDQLTPARIPSIQASKILDISFTETSTMLYLRNGDILFVGSNLDASPLFRTISATVKSFTQETLYSFMHLPWPQRVNPYFSFVSKAYIMAQGQPTIFARPGLEFGFYSSDVPLNTHAIQWTQEIPQQWQLVQQQASNNVASLFGPPYPSLSLSLLSPIQHSIYNTHIFKSDEYVYMFGGFVDQELSNSIYRSPYYDMANEWELVNSTLPFAVASGMTLNDDTYLYIMGGITKMYHFNTTTDTDPSEASIISNRIMRAPLSNLTNWEEVFDAKIPVSLHSAHVYYDVNSQTYFIYGGLNKLSSYPSKMIYTVHKNSILTWNNDTRKTIPKYISTSVKMLTTSDSIYMIGASIRSTNYYGPYILYASKSDPATWIEVSALSIKLNNICANYTYGSCSELDQCECFARPLNQGPSAICFGIEATDPTVCSGNGACIADDVCDCSPSSTGANCSIPMCYGYGATDPLVCSRNGTCLGYNTCSCKANYTGDNCEIPICDGILATDVEVCGGNRSCIAANVCGPFKCFGYANGTIINGVSVVCSSNGNCIGPDVCDCLEGWGGPKCDQPACDFLVGVDACSGNGVCKRQNSASVCECNRGFNGTNCESAFEWWKF
ncbi:hypothetical protein C9374_009406 [Naegleria lovaniensis]|uniref:EGF-like domain-containing protein n=1 Tax=Naegleria lovaniensis TaxID=51637 RepID=A0AA88GIM7_NAELO|nr:uncharacterized protein C9374_009406 [Naegleria lovaniensis]KAG2377495.1 hypothetical protein C9374_009406 [Naegleria lovaniensis]